ncbi:MAG: hypothetical protein AAF548_01190 [Actinomycetota bacterium]
MEHPRNDAGSRGLDLTFTDAAGEPWSLAERRGSIVVLIFHRHIH